MKIEGKLRNGRKFKFDASGFIVGLCVGILLSNFWIGLLAVYLYEGFRHNITE